jgi:hypothetical protein
MPRRWTARDTRAGDTISPESVQQELSSSQSSITTLDRDQLPANAIDESYLEDYAMQRVWASRQFPTTANRGGEQAAARDSDVALNQFLAITYQVFPGSWFECGSATLTGFKGGSLQIEWSGNAVVSPLFQMSVNAPFPGTPKYLRFRILVGGVVLVERRGVAIHNHFRILGGGVFPQGDLPVSFQALATRANPDEPITEDITGTPPIMQAHIYSMRYFAIGRWR